MKILCERNHLLTAAQAAAEVAPSRPTRPIARGVLIEVKTEDDKPVVDLVATDYEIGLRYRLTTKDVSGTGRVVVDAGMLLAVVRDMSGDEISVDAKPEKVVIEGGGGRVSLPVMEAGEFPEVQGAGTDKPVKLPAPEVVRMIDRVAYAAGQEESRYAINGVFMRIKKREMELVATDTRRLAMVRAKLDKDTKLDRGAILPLKLVGMLKKLAAGEEEVGIVLRENEAAFLCGPAVLSGRLVEGTYPKYEEVIPSDYERKATIPKEALRAALKQALNFASDETNAMIFRIGKGKVEVEAKAAERGEASIVIATEYAGPELEIAFRPQFLLDAVARLEKDEVVLEFKDPARPALIAEGRELVSVIMPVRLRTEGA
jgi:DNA polymerase-3 subunit beta